MTWVSRLPKACPSLISRILILVSLAWRYVELFNFHLWSANKFPELKAVSVDSIYQLHPMFGSGFSLASLYILILIVGVAWIYFGGWTALLLIGLDSLVANQGLSLGWGPLVTHPALLLCFLWDYGDEKVHKNFSLIMLVQLMIMYITSVSGKDFHVWYEQGDASYLALTGEYLSTGLGQWVGSLIKDQTLLIKLLSIAPSVLQLSVVLIWLSPFSEKLKKLSYAILIGLGVFHLSMALLLHIKPFSIGCLAIISMYFTNAFSIAQSNWKKYLSYTAIAIWLIGAVIGVFRLPGVFLRQAWLAQNWRIMTQPEPPGRVEAELISNDKVIFKTGSDRNEIAFATAIEINPKIRKYVMRPVCDLGSAGVVLNISHTGGQLLRKINCGD